MSLSSSPGVSELVAAGFKRAGYWKADPEERHGIGIDFTCPREPGIYAFIVEEVVCYVGSAQRGLRKRFRHYAITNTLRTSARVRSEILGCISAEKAVEIYILIPPNHEWNGLPVDLIAGLEEGLIRTIRPTWNRRSNRA